MSEIFTYLKRTEMERKKIKPEPQPTSKPSTANITQLKGNTEQQSDHLAVEENIEIAAISFPITPTRTTYDLDLADNSLKSVLDPSTMIGEQFRLLRAKLTQIQKQKGTKVLLITSATPGEGKTFISCSLAGVFSQELGKRILLIDADLRKPKVGKSFGIGSNEIPGLGNILQDDLDSSELLSGTPNGTLFLLPAGTIQRNPAELLSSKKFENTLSTFRQMFDWIIIDSPPVISIADTNTIAPLCDAIIIVVQANVTPAKIVQETIEMLGREKICGVVLNKSRQKKSTHYYYRYYHAHEKQS